MNNFREAGQRVFHSFFSHKRLKITITTTNQLTLPIEVIEGRFTGAKENNRERQ